MSEGWVFIRPTKLDKFELSFGFLDLFAAWITSQSATSGACMEDEVCDAIRVSNGIVDRSRPSRPKSKKGEPIELRCLDNRFEVFDLTF